MVGRFAERLILIGRDLAVSLQVGGIVCVRRHRDSPETAVVTALQGSSLIAWVVVIVLYVVD